MNITKQQIAELFQKGLNCSQIVLSQFSEKYEMDKKEALRIGCGFGGGARAGELCGAVSGAIMVIGLKYGNDHDQNQQSKMKCYEKTKEFINIFTEYNGSIVCRDLLKCDISTEEGMIKAQKENLFQTLCVDAVYLSIQILSELGY